MIYRVKWILALLVFSFIEYLLPTVLRAEEATSSINTGDTAWLLISTALVMFMIPGLAFFYAGMVRKKNVLATIMHSFSLLCLISVQWVLWGYTASFGSDIGGLIGGLDFLGLKGVGAEPLGTVPHLAFMMFQGMFAAITVALITGAFAERIKFSAFVIFSLLWATLVYDPLAHWTWGGGWLMDLGALDFAGGTVIHISSGVSALVAAIVIGKRSGYPREAMPPHNLTMTVLGTAMLWFGWFGFNGGSALAANGVAANAFVTTNTAASAAALTWLFIEWVHRGKPTVLGAATGAVAGLVGITPGAGFVSPISSIIIGIGAGIFCYTAVAVIKPKFGYDDSLDVFGCHGIGGIWGAIATGLFASTTINPDGANGLFFGNPWQLMVQIISIVATVVFAVVVTFVILKVVDSVVGLRVKEQEELAGLDISQHGESGYTLS
ncbi:MAG: ammonium transporter [Thermodesulfobacteriota bacterium]